MSLYSTSRSLLKLASKSFVGTNEKPSVQRCLYSRCRDKPPSKPKNPNTIILRSRNEDLIIQIKKTKNSDKPPYNAENPATAEFGAPKDGIIIRINTNPAGQIPLYSKGSDKSEKSATVALGSQKEGIIIRIHNQRSSSSKGSEKLLYMPEKTDTVVLESHREDVSPELVERKEKLDRQSYVCSKGSDKPENSDKVTLGSPKEGLVGIDERLAEQMFLYSNGKGDRVFYEPDNSNTVGLGSVKEGIVEINEQLDDGQRCVCSKSSDKPPYESDNSENVELESQKEALVGIDEEPDGQKSVCSKDSDKPPYEPESPESVELGSQKEGLVGIDEKLALCSEDRNQPSCNLENFGQDVLGSLKEERRDGSCIPAPCLILACGCKACDKCSCSCGPCAKWGPCGCGCGCGCCSPTYCMPCYSCGLPCCYYYYGFWGPCGPYHVKVC